MSKRKETLYNRLLKQFTKINDKLPEEQKLSIAGRRRIIRESLLPQFKSIPKSKIRVKAIKLAIFDEYDKQPPKENCDLNYIDPSNLFCNWFEIDEFIRERIPDCIFLRVNAGDFGVTKIFNTRDYNYYSNGVQDITERIRPIAENPNKRLRIYPSYAGIQKLRPKKKNDGTPENYFLDMVLYINDEPVADDDSIRFELPKTKEVREAKRRTKNALDEKLKTLKQKKARKKRARKTLSKNLSLTKQKKVKLKKTANPRVSTQEAYLKQWNKTFTLIENQYQRGLITKEKYNQLSKDLLENFKKGGEV